MNIKQYFLLLLILVAFNNGRAHTNITLNPDKVCLYSFYDKKTDLKVCAERKKIRGVDKLASLSIQIGEETISAKNSTLAGINNPELNTLQIGFSSSNPKELSMYVEFDHELERGTYKSVFFLWQEGDIHRSNIVVNEMGD